MTDKTFEEKMAQLSGIVNQLDQGDIPLETALADFEEGIGLVKDLEKTLSEAKRKLAKVIDENDDLKNLEMTNE